MPEEKKVPEDKKAGEEKGNVIGSLAIFGGIGLILGIALSIYFGSVFIAIILFLLGLLAGIIHYSTKNVMLSIIFIVVVLIAIIVYKTDFISNISPAISGTFSFFKDAFKPISDLFKCGFEECPTAGIKREEIKVPDFQLNIEYENDFIQNNNINLFIKMNLNNKQLDNLTIYPYCYKKINNESLTLSSLQSYSYGDYFVFPKSQQALNTGFRCLGKSDFQSEKVIIGFGIPYTSSLIWTLYTASEFSDITNKKGIQQASPGPYQIFIEMPSDMPLKNGQYEFFLKLKKNYDLDLKEIKYIKLEGTADSDVFCEDFGNEIIVSAEKLKDYWNEKNKEYVFNCNVYISGVSSILEQRVININANYITYKEFEKELRKK